MITFKRSSCLLIVFLLCTTTAFAGIVKGPYLLFEGSNTSMTVLWQDNATESNVIRWGTSTNYTLGQATVAEYGTDHQHRHVITGLQPGTRYYYEVVGYGSGSFRTAPEASATSVKLLAYGDTRSYPAEHEKVAGRMRAAYAADPAFQAICLQAGDWVASNGEANWASEWFVNTNPQMHAFQAEVPVVGARGNHEGTGSIFAKYFPEPYSGGFYWSFDYGPLHVAVVDQYTSYTAGSAQYNWLVNDLAASTKPWKFVVLHEPGWTSGGSHGNNTAVQTVLQPLFKQYGVQLVIGGHNPYYAPAVVDNHQHLTIGVRGPPPYAPGARQPKLVKTAHAHPHTEIDINGNTMVFTVRRSDGTLIESFTILGSVNQPPLAKAGTDQNVIDSDRNGTEVITLNGSASSDPDGSIDSYIWKEGATQIASGAMPSVTLPTGAHTITLTVTDNQGASATDTVVVTVTAANQPPIANAGIDQTVNDSDGNGSQAVTLNGSASSDPDGSISSYVWGEGTAQIAIGATPTVTLSTGIHTINLTVTDNQGATATATVVVTVSPCYAVNAMIPSSCYQSIGAAYLAARNGDTIKAVAMVFTETLNASRAINVTILGGYEPTFTSSGGFSTIRGGAVSRGTLNLGGVKIK